MATTTKAKPDNQSLSRNRSLGRKPKVPSLEDGSSTEHKPEKTLPNYLKPTISSRPDPVKLLKKKDNNHEDNQKLLRRRSFDRPPSSLTSPSTSSHQRIQKSPNISPSRTRDRPREKPVLGLRSSSFHGSRSGVPIAKSPPVAPKKSSLSSTKSKKEGSTNGKTKKASDKEIGLDSVSLSSTQEDEEEVLKVESDVQVSDDMKSPKDEEETQEVQADEQNESSGELTTSTSSVDEDCIVVAKKDEEEKEKSLVNEDKTEDTIEETKVQENNQENKIEEKEEVQKKIDENETPEKVDIDMKEVENVEEKEEEKEEQEVKEEAKVKEEEKEEKKKEVVKGSSSAYNDVIASKMQENPRKNKVLALAGAFQTVIDYETAASK